MPARWARSIERAAIDAGPAARAAAWLSRALAPVAAASAWTGSLLTADGYPVELAWTTAGRSIRYTAEVGPPGRALEHRLEEVDHLLCALGGRRLPPAWARRLRAVQRTGPLAYGAWLGGRHDAGGDRAKCYAEIPVEAGDAADALAADLLGHHGPHRRCALRMVGYDAGLDAFELYFRATDPRALEPAAVAAWIGRDRAALDEVAALADRATGGAAGASGWSVATDRAGAIGAASWFHFAEGGDDAVRRRVLALAAERGWDLGDYPGLAAAGARHGLLAFTLGRTGPVQLGVGLSPPAIVDAYRAR